MGDERTLRALQWTEGSQYGRASDSSPVRLVGREDCLEQLLQAFQDLADRDDIHQAASRLKLVQQWIRDEAQTAEADPIFAGQPLLS